MKKQFKKQYQMAIDPVDADLQSLTSYTFKQINLNKMKSNKPEQHVKSSLKDIGKLYQNETFIQLFNDFVAIGTWPTPEKPKLKIKRNADGTVAIDSVPPPEKQMYLKFLIYELLEESRDMKVAKIIR